VEDPESVHKACVYEVLKSVAFLTGVSALPTLVFGWPDHRACAHIEVTAEDDRFGRFELLEVQQERGSHKLWRSDNRPRSPLALGVYTVTRKKSGYSAVSTRPSLCGSPNASSTIVNFLMSFSSSPDVTLSGVVLVKIAVPE